MAVGFLLIFLYVTPLTDAKISQDYTDPNNNLQVCLNGIINKYFHHNKELTCVSMNDDNDEIIKTLHSIKLNSILLRTPDSAVRYNISTEGYFIVASNPAEFIDNLPSLVEEAPWNPDLRLIIIINSFTKNDLRHIFDTLLMFHVSNVIIMNKTSDPNIYSYNPYENYGCGKRYDRIIDFGACSTTQDNLYPLKPITGLRNCTLNIAIPHWPPYTINPERMRRTDLVGAEETIVKQISELEGFELNFTYTDDAEIYTMIGDNNTAVGPLYLLQKGDVDMIFGGMLLTHPRAKAFHYVWGHLAHTEDISYQVKKATFVPTWKNMYLEFNSLVWIALVIAFLVFFLIFVILIHPKDKGRLVLLMVSYFFLTGNKMHGSFFARYLFIHWVLFAYLINVYYQSSLVGLTTDLAKEYQISDENDIAKYKLKPCVSSGVNSYIKSVEKDSYESSTHAGCTKLLRSMKTVSESKELFTITLYSLYVFNQYDYYDDFGDSMIYTFNKPLVKAIYTIYFYKGFPMLDRIQMHALRLRENGLVMKYFNTLQWKKNGIYHFNAKKIHPHVIVAWYLLLFGYSISSVVFIIEIIVNKFMTKLEPNVFRNSSL